MNPAAKSSLSVDAEMLGGVGGRSGKYTRIQTNTAAITANSRNDSVIKDQEAMLMFKVDRS